MSRSISAQVFPLIDGAAVNDRFFRVVRTEYGARRHAAEHLARDAGVTPRCARNWLAGTCAPQAHSLLQLMTRCDALAAEIQSLMRT